MAYYTRIVFVFVWFAYPMSSAIAGDQADQMRVDANELFREMVNARSKFSSGCARISGSKLDRSPNAGAEINGKVKGIYAFAESTGSLQSFAKG